MSARHPAWCANADDRCEHSAELFLHRSRARTIVTASGQVLQAWTEQFAAFYSPATAATSVVLTLIGGATVRLTGPQARTLGSHLAELAGMLTSFDLVARAPGVEPHPTWCAWASTADGNACRDRAYTRHHLTEMFEVLSNDGTLIEVEGGIWVSDLAASDPLITLDLDGQEVMLTPAQAVELAATLTPGHRWTSAA
ncbi:hypothetical protein ACIBI9_04295 [Nonomuraea sp. NPDC050451]|uniref:hypothetical protein n=1 Tax=Nonomuraea sp. NPDC050451 TaxID=3364364 RepID=UPI0037BC9016